LGVDNYAHAWCHPRSVVFPRAKPAKTPGWRFFVLARITPIVIQKRSIPVNKTELIEHMAKSADLSKASAARALDAMVDGVRKTLKKGGTVSLVGFGTFAVGKRAARTGRNPQTGATIKIKAAKVPKFRAGKGLKDAINGGK
jgi:DNA-binding protein HU-beta